MKLETGKEKRWEEQEAKQCYCGLQLEREEAQMSEKQLLPPANHWDTINESCS